jgi:hypothetical protein
MEEAMMRYSPDDDGNRESYWNRAYEIFSEAVKHQNKQALAVADHD